ncbi:MAG: hypothetical protein UY10_C0050G0001, partial [Microgenomates group bacterium GW2011_GWA2_47_8]
MKRRVRKKLVKVISTITDGVLGSVTDFTLLFLFSALAAAKPGRRTMSDVLFGPNDALEWHEELNYHVIKRAVYKLTTKGLVQRVKKQDELALAITDLGRKRIEAIIPVYHTKRPWDGHVYLISYDIPSTNNSERNLLREHIRKTGGALLQAGRFGIAVKGSPEDGLFGEDGGDLLPTGGVVVEAEEKNP